MPSFILLTGAGFSRNWGGWLADEVFDYLLGCRELDASVRKLLWDTKPRGGFEAALSELGENRRAVLEGARKGQLPPWSGHPPSSGGEGHREGQDWRGVP